MIEIQKNAAKVHENQVGTLELLDMRKRGT